MPGSIWWGVSAVSGGGHNLAYLGGLQLLRFEARRHAGQLVRVALAFLGEGRLLLLVPGEGGVHHAPAVHLPCTCRARAMHKHVLCTSTCYAHAVHMPCTCICTCTCTCTCYAHAMHMLCTCRAYAVHMLCIYAVQRLCAALRTSRAGGPAPPPSLRAAAPPPLPCPAVPL